MKGKIKKLDGLYPVSVAEAIYIEKNITLKQAIESGMISGGSGQLSSGRGYSQVHLRGGIINIEKSRKDNTVYYKIPKLDYDRYRRLFCWTSSGGNRSIDIPDGELLDNDALILNTVTATISKKNASWGNVVVSKDEILLLYNNLGNIHGALSYCCVYGYDNISIPVVEVNSELISTTGTTQGIFIIGDNIYKCSHSNDEHTDFANISVVQKNSPNTPVKTISHNLGHLNSPDYSIGKDSLIVGNGSKNYTLPLKGWIFKNFSSIVEGFTIDFNTIEKVELDFSQFNESKCQLCWGYDNTDIIYMCTDDCRVIRKILLGKGDDNKGLGNFILNTPENEYNGSYDIINTWISRQSDILGGMIFYKGHLYMGIKGAYGLRKVTFLNNGYFDSAYFETYGKLGDIQGLALDESSVYWFSDYEGYKFSKDML